MHRYRIAVLIASLTVFAPPAHAAGVLLAVQEGDNVVVESRAPAGYKLIVDGKRGESISEVHLPSSGAAAIRDLNGLFFHGTHGEQYTLRGWTELAKCVLSSSAKIVSKKPDEVVVQASVQAAGTFKVLEPNKELAAKLRADLHNYKEETIRVNRRYTFKPDRVLMHDEVLWVHGATKMTTLYFTSHFLPATVQSPLRMVKGGTKASFGLPGSGGEKVPAGISYPFTTENFLRNGFKVTARTTGTSFGLASSDMYHYEKPWQTDWDQNAGFMYRTSDVQPGRPVTLDHEVVFSRARGGEMPPVVSISGPNWDARFKDDKGEIPPYKLGQTVEFAASAVNSDGTPVPEKDISWEVHMDPFWTIAPEKRSGARMSYKLAGPSSDADKQSLQKRNGQILLVGKAVAKGKNGAEAFQPFAVLVGQ